MTRRNWLGAAGAAAQVVSSSAQTPPPSDGISDLVVANANRGVENLLSRQIMDPKSRHRGGIPDADGLVAPGTAGSIIEVFGTAYLYQRTKYYKNPLMIERIKIAVDWVTAGITKDGNIDLPITNFNSTPDTAFFTNPIATVAVLARRYKVPELTNLIEPLLHKVGQGLLHGGVHTPNHRWVVSSALAQLHELFGGDYAKRANQWLREGIDMDPDGQYSERSTTVYNTVSDRGLTMAAIKLNRPDLLDYVRRNLDSMMYLLHPGNEVVTEISKRQDKNVRAKPDRYWFPAKYLAVKDNNGLYESFAEAGIGGQQLSLMLEYPELAKKVTPKPIPDNYVKVFPTVGIGRVRRGTTSATIQFTGADRVFCLRRGDVVMNGIRFASAFFGKGQFVPTAGGPKGDGVYEFSQSLEGPYYQPLDEKPEPPIIYHEQWGASWKKRKQSNICKLTQTAVVTEDSKGFSVRIQSSGTNEVPVAVEISFAPGGVLEGCEKLKGEEQYLLPAGKKGSYKVGKDTLTFGPGLSESHYVNVRGALPKLDGTSVYLTGYTPFDQTIRFDWA